MSFCILQSKKRESFKDPFKKGSKRQNVKEKDKRKHTIYLSPEQSEKLRLYAAKKDKPLSEIIERLIKKNL